MNGQRSVSAGLSARAVWRLAGLVVLWLGPMALGGCATPAGDLFPPIEPPLNWPSPPQRARIRYVGQLASSADLKPPKSGWQVLRETLSGPPPVRSMVAPIAVWTSKAGQLFVADSSGQTVHRFDLRQRTYQPIFQVGQRRLVVPVAVSGDDQGVVYVADADHRAVHRFAASGAYLGHLPCDPLAQPAGLAYDPGREWVYISDVANHQVFCVDRSGTLIRAIGQRGAEPGQFNYPTYLTVDGTGRLLVADTLNYRIQRFHPDGGLDLAFGQQGTAPGDFALPKGIAVDRHGHIYVVDARFENVQVFDDQGALLIPFGQEGGGPGEFWLPAGIHVDATDRIFVADTYNRRIQVFQYLAGEDTPL